MRRIWRFTAIFVGVAVLVWLLLPAAEGYHTGYNSATDNVCTVRLIQWCKDDASLDLSPGYKGPVNDLPDCQLAAPPCRNAPYP